MRITKLELIVTEELVSVLSEDKNISELISEVMIVTVSVKSTNDSVNKRKSEDKIDSYTEGRNSELGSRLREDISENREKMLLSKLDEEVSSNSIDVTKGNDVLVVLLGK